MMWNPFKREEPVTYRTRKIDWSRVKTIEDVILILSKESKTKNIRVAEEYWQSPGLEKLLGSTITESTYNGFVKVSHKEYESDES